MESRMAEPTAPHEPRHADRALMRDASSRALEFLESLPERVVAAEVDLDQLRDRLGGPVPERGIPAAEVLADLDDIVRPGLVASAGPRFFGFVIGGVHPVALAADWLVSTWDQNLGLHVLSPPESVAEETAAGWILELLGLPSHSSVGFVTGGQMASFTGLSAARQEMLRRAGWDVNARGLVGSPGIDIVAGEEAHITIHRALRYLGIGTDAVRTVAADREGRMKTDSLREVLSRCERPTIVCAQAGDVNSGAFDPFEEIVPIVREHGAWLHVDGAFGLWAAATDSRKHLTRGVAGADSWAVDAHKWLNVPQDCGIAIVAHPEAHRAAVSTTTSYLIKSEGAERDPVDWTPEFSRRARSIPVYATLRHLGRDGVVELVDRCCALTLRMVERLAVSAHVRVLNDVVLNQALIRFVPPEGDADAMTRDVIRRVQREGTCWLGGTVWKGEAAMRVSVINWSTTEDDIDRSADAILHCLDDALLAAGSGD
jgi:glutamate/tyrosine decarboxylase-like PLP-dependent enzyme